jgi:hypothetical protein
MMSISVFLNRRSRESGNPVTLRRTPLGPRLRGDDIKIFYRAGIATGVTRTFFHNLNVANDFPVIDEPERN